MNTIDGHSVSQATGFPPDHRAVARVWSLSRPANAFATRIIIDNTPTPPPGPEHHPLFDPPKPEDAPPFATPVAAPVHRVTSPPSGINSGLNFIQIIMRVVIPLTILAAGGAVMVISGILRPAPQRETTTVGPPRVKTVPIELWEDELTLDVDGSVVPFREVAVTAEVAGRVIQKSDVCRAGNYVKAGTLLFEINPVDFELRADQLAKQVKQAEISLHQIDVETENYRSLIDLAMEDAQLQAGEVSRLRTLVADRASSASELDRARRTELAARNSLEQLKNQTRLLVTRRAGQQSAIEVATSQLEQAELDLKRTKITSPIDGVIVSELVQKDAFVSVGAPLVNIEDTSSVEVLCNLRSEQLYQLWESRAASESDLRSFPGSDSGTHSSYELPRVAATVVYQVAGRRFAWDGRLDRYDGLGLDPRTRTIPVRVVVKNPQDGRALQEESSSVPPALVRGMYVTVALNVDTQTRTLAKLPASAIRPGKIIYRFVDGKLKMEKVRVARLTDAFAAIEIADADFAIGDPVITTPLPSPEDGMSLELAEPPKDDPSPATAERAPPGSNSDRDQETSDISLPDDSSHSPDDKAEAVIVTSTTLRTAAARKGTVAEISADVEVLP